jgi:hypothetical protein
MNVQMRGYADVQMIEITRNARQMSGVSCIAPCHCTSFPLQGVRGLFLSYLLHQPLGDIGNGLVIIIMGINW